MIIIITSFSVQNILILIKINVLKAKENYFGILHLNIAALNKNIHGISNLLSLMRLNFPTTDLSEHKIGLNTPINNMSL